MGSSERPHKMRKLSHDGSVVLDAANSTFAASLADVTAKESFEDRHNGNYGDGPDAAEAQVDSESLLAPTDVAPMLESADGESTFMSKNQLKKLRKKQEWEAGRDARKVFRKEKLLAKRQRKKEAYEKAQAEGNDFAQPGRKISHQRPVQLPVTILIDCDFDDLMRENERKSLEKQVTRAYSDNKLSKYRVHLTICSFGGNLKERFDGILGCMYKNWRGTRFLTEDFVDTAEQAKDWMCAVDGGVLKGVFEKHANVDDAMLKEQGEVVYLSSEAEETLMELKPYSTYVIGGLVDKNREKGICYKRATQRGVRTAKLPIGEYLDMSSRKVLATNHVNEIMLKWLECGDWADAFMKVIPKRKGGQLKNSGGQREGSEAAEDGSGDDDDDVEATAVGAVAESRDVPTSSK